LRGALKGAALGAVTAGLMEGVAQYVFGTSTVGVAAQAMQLEKAGIPKETIAKLYGSDGSGRPVTKQEYAIASAEGAGKFSKEEIQQLQDALSTTKANATKKVFQNKLGRDNAELTKHFGTAREAKTVLTRTEQILDLANQTNIYNFIKVDGFCGGSALACVVPGYGNNVFIEPGFFDPSRLAASYAAPGITQAHVLTHEFAHLAGMGHSLSYNVTNQMVLGNLVLSPSSANNAIYNAESYAWYINGF